MAKSRWTVSQRQRFLARLAETGDPATAAASVSRRLDEAYALRAAEPGFDQGWSRAVDIAWDLVEAKVLARILATEDTVPTSARIVDSKLALAILQRRSAAPAARGGDDGPDIAALREEIRLLAASEEN
jgi:hypothetical protein